jgi:hypothetical protein
MLAVWSVATLKFGASGRVSSAADTSREFIVNGIYVNTTTTRQYMINGVYVNAKAA